MFQSGRGRFEYSDVFKAEYERRFGYVVDPTWRIDHDNALEVYSALGPWGSSGSRSNIMVAIAPRKALSAGDTSA